jgi:hypothetical protein
MYCGHDRQFYSVLEYGQGWLEKEAHGQVIPSSGSSKPSHCRSSAKMHFSSSLQGRRCLCYGRQARSSAEVAHILPEESIVRQNQNKKREITYLGGGFLTNSMPFSMLALRPVIATSMSFFSWALALPRTLMAFSAPEV